MASGHQRIAARIAAVPPRRAHSQVVRAYTYALIAALDITAITGSLLTADLLRHGRLTDVGSPAFLLIVPIFVASAFLFRCYSYANTVSLRNSISRMMMALTGALATTLMITFALKNSGDLSRVAFFSGAAISYGALALVRVPFPGMIARMGPRFIRRVLVVDGEFDDEVPAVFERFDMQAIGIVPDLGDPMMLDGFSQLVSGADRVVVSCPVEHRANWTVYLKSVDCAGELLVPELRGIELLHHDFLSGLCGVAVSAGSFDIRNRVVKRLFDLCVCVPIILVLSPLFVIAAIAILIESGRPILFRQQRLGRANQLFDVYKFRSMYVDDADQHGERSTGRSDARVTRVGRIIRATSIDELPQLFNVINGDMSLVGPRPHALGSRAGEHLFWDVDPRYWLRHAIKPGLTGLAQVRGYRGATDHRDDLADRLESDLDYIAEWTILRDIAILMRTILVLVHRNAY